MLRHAQRRIILPFVLPAAALLGLFFVYPLVRTVVVSLSEYSRTGRSHFVGLDKYQELLHDPAYVSTLKNSFVFALIGGVLLFPLSIAIAWALKQRLRGESFFRFCIFAPVVLSAAVVSLMWKFLYNPTLGLINPALEGIGLGGLTRAWLGDPATALPAIALTVVWQGVGIWVILISAGFERLPTEVLEAGRIDGASEWRLFRSVMLPMMRDLFRVLVVLWIVQAMQAFAFVHIMTDGGPFGSSDIVANLMYRTAFDQGDFGLAAAMGIVLVVVMLAVALLVNKVMKSHDIEY
ncbi:carbohydrate ABC transporter permease [Nakamurella lactea]|uniref:carbohydrate ABC transporter permease n=1 Tax=Nakamurella lactea TaxID=459515 RepID=UPI000403933C|nr:sugar ABC transporter permease [Nakamurella lactea]